MSVFRMSHRLTSFHRAWYSQQYVSGTCAHITTSSVFRAPFDVKNEDDFKTRVLLAKKPIVVDFHAEWCGPCKVLGPRLDSIIAEQNGKVELAKVDIDHLGELAFNYDVTVVPTVLGIKDGRIINKFTGALETQEIKDFVNQLIK